MVGAVVGGAVNLRFVYLLGEAARMVFIARRLKDDGMPLSALLQREALAAASIPKSRPLTVKRKPAAKAVAAKKISPRGKSAATRRRPAPAP